jgi:alkylation response protein AidB-like acyl-CoA dehydrogenase
MDFLLSDDLAAHRKRAREWVEANAPFELVLEQRRSGLYTTVEVHERLARDGILGAGWDPAYGGSDVDPDFAAAVFQELTAKGFHQDAWSTTAMVIRTIDAVATHEQKLEYVAGALRGEVLIALGYSEPDSGSDVAAAKTAAVQDGDEWVVNGQKMWTSTAQICSHVFVLARTDRSVPKHEGLSLFMVPTASEGFECHPMQMLGGQTTTTTYYSDVRVPASALIGDVNRGWSVMNVALVYERGVGGTSAFEHPVGEELAHWASAVRHDDGTTLLDDPLLAERVGRMLIDDEVSNLLALRANWLADKGDTSTAHGAMRKLFSGEASLRNCTAAIDAMGAEGLLEAAAGDAPLGGDMVREFRYSVVKTIYGGSSEIMRDIIAQKFLGLPKNRPKN